MIEQQKGYVDIMTQSSITKNIFLKRKYNEEAENIK